MDDYLLSRIDLDELMKKDEPPLEFPDTLEGFEYAFNEKGQLRHIKTGEPFVFNYREDLHRWNQKRYEALGEIITKYIYELLEEECHLKKVYVPLTGRAASELYPSEMEKLTAASDCHLGNGGPKQGGVKAGKQNNLIGALDAAIEQSQQLSDSSARIQLNEVEYLGSQPSLLTYFKNILKGALQLVQQASGSPCIDNIGTVAQQRCPADIQTIVKEVVNKEVNTILKPSRYRL
ncbi:hypothetical protein JD844_008805 [Phrynosoma platyrhinos]|uniref:Arb2 domain-containing protein n=1 Tax=Phrynosoma platyrhinos TaxID=52577 RepID=A0ABQ7TF23_PHRPL|nr:hypothetical protein JD844_008805 [Phrynosoma platyrhinos]